MSVQHEQTTLQILRAKLGPDDLRTQVILFSVGSIKPSEYSGTLFGAFFNFLDNQSHQTRGKKIMVIVIPMLKIEKL